MAVNVPGLSLSLLRQQTSVQAGLPLLISGRFTAFGLGVPAFIRVFLEGPSYDPQIRSFDTFGSPFSGDYSVNVIAEKDGQYNVYAQASPPPLIPTGPPFPEAMMLLPPIAESTKPPLVVGYPFEGGVDALLPDGTRQRLPAPEMLDIEITPIITIGAPAITFPPGAPRMIPYAPPPARPPAPIPPYFPPEPVVPEPVVPEPVVPEPVAPEPVAPEVPTRDILVQPSLNLPRQINVGDTWSGSVSLPTFGTVPYFVEGHLVMIDPSGYQWTVGQSGRTLSPWETLQVPINFDTAGLPAGNYDLSFKVYDQVGHLVAQFPMGFLTMIAVVPEIPTPVAPLAAPSLVDTFGPAWVLEQSEWLAAGYTGNRYAGTYAQWKYAFELAHPGQSFENYVIANLGFDPSYAWWARWGRYGEVAPAIPAELPPTEIPGLAEFVAEPGREEFVPSPWEQQPL